MLKKLTGGGKKKDKKQVIFKEKHTVIVTTESEKAKRQAPQAPQQSISNGKNQQNGALPNGTPLVQHVNGKPTSNGDLMNHNKVTKLLKLPISFLTLFSKTNKKY